MKKWRKDRTRMAWSLAWAFAVIFHRVLIPLLQGNDFEPTEFVITTAYFGFITFLLTWVFFLFPAGVVAIFLFIFGALVELFVFQVIFDPLLAGLFYVAMFFIPRWIARRMFADQKPTESSSSENKNK
jgi:hypothetical protein